MLELEALPTDFSDLSDIVVFFFSFKYLKMKNFGNLVHLRNFHNEGLVFT
jgi:hypothetical protein